MVSLKLQLESLGDLLEGTELLYRVSLLSDVVGKDWVIKSEMERLSLDASVMGLGIPMLLSEWLTGTYKNGVLDKYKYWVMIGIDWLITGDRGYLLGIDRERLDEVEGLIGRTMKGYLEDLYYYSM